MMPTSLFKSRLSKIVSRLPMWPPSLVLGQVLNQALKPLIESGDLLPLSGKRTAIIVEDLGLHFSFTLRQNRFTPIARPDQADLTIRSTLHDFYLLATRQEDPDTLFFNRRLVIEGDTELGLIAKNTMDSLELPKPVLALCSALKKIDALHSSPNQQFPV